MSTDSTLSGREDLKSTTYEFFILAIAILSVLNMAFWLVLPFESRSWWLIVTVDSILTIIFLADFAFRVQTAPTSAGTCATVAVSSTSSAAQRALPRHTRECERLKEKEGRLSPTLSSC